MLFALRYCLNFSERMMLTLASLASVTTLLFLLVLRSKLSSIYEANPFSPELIFGMPKISIKVSDAIWHRWDRKG